MYAPGHTNIADALSRLMSNKGVVQKTNVDEKYIHFVSHSAVHKVMTLTDIGDASANDPDLHDQVTSVHTIWSVATV